MPSLGCVFFVGSPWKMTAVTSHHMASELGDGFALESGKMRDQKLGNPGSHDSHDHLSGIS